VVLLNTKHRYPMHNEVSVGTVKASLVVPVRYSARPYAGRVRAYCSVITTPAASRIHRPRIASSRADRRVRESSWEIESWIT